MGDDIGGGGITIDPIKVAARMGHKEVANYLQTHAKMQAPFYVLTPELCGTYSAKDASKFLQFHLAIVLKLNEEGWPADLDVKFKSRQTLLITGDELRNLNLINLQGDWKEFLKKGLATSAGLRMHMAEFFLSQLFIIEQKLSTEFNAVNSQDEEVGLATGFGQQIMNRSLNEALYDKLHHTPFMTRLMLAMKHERPLSADEKQKYKQRIIAFYTQQLEVETREYENLERQIAFWMKMDNEKDNLETGVAQTSDILGAQTFGVPSNSLGENNSVFIKKIQTKMDALLKPVLNKDGTIIGHEGRIHDLKTQIESLKQDDQESNTPQLQWHYKYAYRAELAETLCACFEQISEHPELWDALTKLLEDRTPNPNSYIADWFKNYIKSTEVDGFIGNNGFIEIYPETIAKMKLSPKNIIERVAELDQIYMPNGGVIKAQSESNTVWRQTLQSLGL